MRASDSRFEHPAAPHGDAVLPADLFHPARFDVTAHSSELDVDDPAGAELAEERLDALEAEAPLPGRAREEEVERRLVVVRAGGARAARAQAEAQPVAAGLPLMWRNNWPTVRLSW